MEAITPERIAKSTQLKADFVPITVLKLQDCQLNQIESELKKTISTAPSYFNQAPVVIDVSSVSEPLKAFLDIPALCTLLRSLQMIPVGIRGIHAKQASLARESGLALLSHKMPPSLEESNPLKEEKPLKKSTTKSAGPRKDQPNKSSKITKIIDKPIRSGTQVYAPGGDLIVLSAVNAGAEVIADGNIHIHGPLRGRALAGAQGDIHARIFCQRLEAELVAIAGHYRISEQLPELKNVKSMVQISLQSDKLIFDLT